MVKPPVPLWQTRWAKIKQFTAFRKPKIVTEAWKRKVRRYDRILNGFKDADKNWHPGLTTGLVEPVAVKVKSKLVKAKANEALYGKSLRGLKLRGVIAEKGTKIRSDRKGGVAINEEGLPGFTYRYHQIRAQEYLDLPEQFRPPFEEWIKVRIQRIVNAAPKSSRWIIGCGQHEIKAPFNAGAVIDKYEELAVRYGRPVEGVDPGESQHPTEWMLTIKEVILDKVKVEDLANYLEIKKKRKRDTKKTKRRDGRIDKSKA
jgi:hypothetical protein